MAKSISIVLIDGKRHRIIKEGKEIIKDEVLDRDPRARVIIQKERAQKIAKEEARKKKAEARRKEAEEQKRLKIEAGQKANSNNQQNTINNKSKRLHEQNVKVADNLRLAYSSKQKSTSKPSSANIVGDSKPSVSNTVSQKVRIDWKDIRFLDRSIYFRYNNVPYTIPSDGARAAFNKIKLLFVDRLPKLEVKISGSKASINNTIDYERVIKYLDICQIYFVIQQDNFPLVGGLHQFPASWIDPLIPKDKSEYIDYLRLLQSDDERIIPVNESSANGMVDGFLFTIKTEKKCYVIWESIESQISRATYLFDTTLDRIDLTHQLVFDYINSDIEKKRLNLWGNKVKEFAGIRITHIEHDDFNSWKERIDSIVKPDSSHFVPSRVGHGPISSSGKEVKNTGDIEYEIHRSVKYNRVHNDIQNKCREILESTHKYSRVVLEDNNVDIKAFSKNGSVEYYEVKTEVVAQKNIRQAIGQLMEYVYYRPDHNVTKMYIVGPCRPTEADLSYLKLLREKHNLPVFYLQFNTDTNNLVFE